MTRVSKSIYAVVLAVLNDDTDAFQRAAFELRHLVTRADVDALFGESPHTPIHAPHCVYCAHLEEDHAEGSCLFGPTRFSPCDVVLAAEVVYALPHANLFIEAIKRQRADTGCGLKEAKDLIEAEIKRHHLYTRGVVSR